MKHAGPRWISGLHGLRNMISSSTYIHHHHHLTEVKMYRKVQSPNKYMVILVCMQVAYNWTKTTDVVHCMHVLTLGIFSPSMMQHNSYVSSSIIRHCHQLHGIFYFICYWTTVQPSWTAFSCAYDIDQMHSSNTHIQW